MDEYYYILKRIKTNNLDSALKKESKAVVISVYKESDINDIDDNIVKGFKYAK